MILPVASFFFDGAEYAEQYNQCRRGECTAVDIALTLIPTGLGKLFKGGAKVLRAAENGIDAVDAGSDLARTTIRNGHLAGKAHPVTGVLFDGDGFPIFDSLHQVELPGNLRGSSVTDPAQFQYATQNLNQLLGDNPALRVNFTEEQLQAISQGAPKIPGLTWHHYQDGATLQLVDTTTHRLTGHTGGRALTGGR